MIARDTEGNLWEMDFTVEGEPMPAPRPRFTKFGHAYMPSDYVERKEVIADLAEKTMQGYNPMKGELEMVLIFAMKPPKSLNKTDTYLCMCGEKRPVKRGDIDNLSKTIMDSLNGVAYFDDSQVVTLVSTKIYAKDKPYTKITVRKTS